MIAKDRKRISTKFYQEDLVRNIQPPNTYGVILRCWHDADVPLDGPIMDPIMRPLQQGEVGVQFFPPSVGNRDILPESDFHLIDRSFNLGDLCKRSVDDVCSGVIIGVRVEGKLEHAVSGAPVDGWKTAEDIRCRAQAEIGDYVIYDDWVGQVVELYDESVVEVASGHQLLRLPELSTRLTVGDKGNDILPTPMGVQSIFGYLTGNLRPSTTDTVIAVNHTVLAIAWLALNQSLDPMNAETRGRPDRLWYGPDLANLTLVPSKLEQFRAGEKVILKNAHGLPTTTHGNDPAALIVVQTFVVKETRTTVNVLWQDGRRETVRTTELIPYLNPDESDCWPGDHVLWKGESETRPAIVQSVNAAERTATILYPDAGVKDLASLLELDPHGTSEISANSISVGEGLGVHRGDFVFVHRPGSWNGLAKPRVPHIGELEAWVRESPISTDGKLFGWRLEMSELGAGIAAGRSSLHFDQEEGQIRRLRNGDTSLSWFGEVTELRLDGTVEVTGPDFSVAVYPIERLTKLSDGLEQIDMFGDDMSDDQDFEMRDGEEVWAMDEAGVWQPYDPSAEDADEWEETDDDGDVGMDVDRSGWTENSNGTDNSPSLPSAIPSSSEPLHAKNILPELSQPTTPPTLSPTPLTAATSTDSDTNSAAEEVFPVNRFDILPSAPPDHAFYNSTPAQHSKFFLTRLSREYRVLASSLPESIIVRTYEDRTDLLRSLIVGPENTPYENAPFVIDWMLDSNFPNSAPIAHFWSWTGGNGRVNPNLYEEGKVCLSILGTWGGDKTEVWSAARSSLLQALVSIQGLVLVKEPWFCEPAYEKLRGTEEGIVNSRLYNEKAYVLSRGFVRRALEVPVGGLEAEINTIYYTNKLLSKVVRDAQTLIEKSKSTPGHLPHDEDLDRAVPKLTVGGIITLDRTLTKLQLLLDRSIS